MNNKRIMLTLLLIIAIGIVIIIYLRTVSNEEYYAEDRNEDIRMYRTITATEANAELRNR